MYKYKCNSSDHAKYIIEFIYLYLTCSSLTVEDAGLGSWVFPGIEVTQFLESWETQKRWILFVVRKFPSHPHGLWDETTNKCGTDKSSWTGSGRKSLLVVTQISAAGLFLNCFFPFKSLGRLLRDQPRDEHPEIPSMRSRRSSRISSPSPCRLHTLLSALFQPHNLELARINP